MFYLIGHDLSPEGIYSLWEVELYMNSRNNEFLRYFGMKCQVYAI